MTMVSEEASEQTLKTGEPQDRYVVDQRVVWTVNVNSPGHYMPGTKQPGTVITAFENGKSLTYRIRLDAVWGERIATKSLVGERIVVGNISAKGLLPLLEEPVPLR